MTDEELVKIETWMAALTKDEASFSIREFMSLKYMRELIGEVDRLKKLIVSFALPSNLEDAGYVCPSCRCSQDDFTKSCENCGALMFWNKV